MKKQLLILCILSASILHAQYTVKLLKNNGNNFTYDESNVVAFNNNIIFTGRDSANGDVEIWKTNGITTSLFLDVYGNNRSSRPNCYKVAMNKLFFQTDDTISNDKYLNVTDGTPTGTILGLCKIKSVDQDKILNSVELNGNLYFTNTSVGLGSELWVTDGTKSGTKLVLDINTGSAPSDPALMTLYNNKIYFTAITATKGTEIWSTDGTASGTQLLLDINLNTTSTNYLDIIVFNNVLYFGANNAKDYELWSSDGTPSGTVVLKDINASGSSRPQYFAINNNKLYFSANDGINGVELFETDGTINGTQLSNDVIPGATGSFPKYIYPVGNKLYFRSQFLFTQFNLQTYDVVTGKLDTLYYDANTNVSDLLSTGNNLIANVGNQVFFTIYDKQSAAYNRVWTTDGTKAGTYQLNYYTGTQNLIQHKSMAVLNGEVYLYSTHGGATDSYSFFKISNGTTSINDIVNSSNFNVYPNPNNGQFTVQLTNPNKNSVLEVCNLLGEKVYSQQIISSQTQLNLNVNAGIYFVNVTDIDGGRSTQKIVIQ